MTNNNHHTRFPVTKHAIRGVTLTPRDGYYQIRKINLTADRVKKDPAFRRTRMQAKQFGSVVTLTKRLGEALLPATGVKIAARKLTSVLARAIQSDTVNVPGFRTVLEGQWQYLQGFDLNAKAPLNEVMNAVCACRYNETTQEINVQVPVLIPAINLAPPPGSTHYRVKCTVISVDETHAMEQSPWQQSTLIPIKQVTMPATNKTFKIATGKPRLHLVVLFIQWYGPAAGKDKQLHTTPGSLNIVAAYKTW